MKKLLGTLILVGVMMLAMAVPASAFEMCFGFTSYGNKFKFEVTQHGNFFALNGSDRVFAERAVTGTAYLAANNTVRMGFLHVANNGPSYSDIVWNANLSLSTLSGPITGRTLSFGTDLSDTLSAISCAGVADSQSLPDAMGK